MGYTLLSGKEASTALLAKIKTKVDAIKASGKRPPHLTAVLVGSDGASLTYVESKVKHCQELGFGSSLLQLPEETSQDELLRAISALNNDESVDGFIVQSPLPNHIDADTIISAIDPAKDVDGFHPENIGKMVKGWPCFIPATPLGVIRLMEHYGIETSGKHVVVIGRSHIVGLPMSILLQRNANPGNCTVTLCHSRTIDLAKHTQQADILIAALGRPGFVKAEMVKEGAVVIDVGITRVADATKKRGFAVKGDVDFDNVAPKTSAITPVPGGVGLMTIAGLLENTLLAWELTEG